MGTFRVDIGFFVDPLAMTMVLFITGIGALIHLYAIGYMKGDEKFSKFFVYLNLFIFAMLMLVLGNNLLVTFLGWEGVGACSYFLISFWFTDRANASAGKKAFVTNRVGDWGFMVAIFLTFVAIGSINYPDIIASAKAGEIAAVTATAITLLLLVGAVGKSAQLPLFVWLPDAMAGPTPVSALIHAATMVTAGVYLLTRMSPVIAVSYDWAPQLIAWLGAITALFAATAAVAQNDIKKVLAYSTISQLGYLFLAVGVGGYVAGIFHMVTHAFFKALLFLAAGSVLHGMHHEQDMRRFGGLYKLLPVTCGVFIVGCAGHRRRAAVQRLLVEGRDPRLRLGRQQGPLADRPGRGAAHRLLHEPGHVPHVLRPLPLRGPHPGGDRRGVGRQDRRQRSGRRELPGGGGCGPHRPRVGEGRSGRGGRQPTPRPRSRSRRPVPRRRRSPWRSCRMPAARWRTRATTGRPRRRPRPPCGSWRSRGRTSRRRRAR